MIEKERWVKNTYDQHAVMEETEEYEAVIFPMSVSNDDHVKLHNLPQPQRGHSYVV